MEYSREALGQVIRELREGRSPKLSQEQLGRKAGYRAGAGVSMSRIENGLTRPSPHRLEAIAKALGLSLHELEARGARRSRRAADAGRPGRVSGGDQESVKDRMRRIQADYERRNTEAVARGHEFNAAHDSARDGFFMALVSTSRTIRDMPRPAGMPGETRLDVDRVSPTAEAAARREVAAHGISVALASGAGAAAAEAEPDQESAYSAVVAAAILVPAEVDTAYAEPQSGPTARATRALLGSGAASGGTGILTGAALLAGFLASAASPLIAAGTLAWMARRSRRQNDQLRIELDRAEANLAATQPGFDAVMDILGRATELLGYIAVHASHALHRWHTALPAGPIRWTDLRPEQQRQYHAFVDIAACQVAVESINITELLAAPAEHQARLIQIADDILTPARKDVELLV